MSVKINISTLTQKEQEKIDSMLTFTPKSNIKNYQNFTPSEDPIKCYYTKDKKVHLPYRFACMYFKKVFNTEKYPDMHSSEIEFKGKLLSRQEQPYKKSLEFLKKCNTCTIALYPGFGKTFLGCMLSYNLNNITCVLIHRENIAHQWVKSFEKFIPDIKEQICFVDKKINTDAKIFICMADRTDRIPDNIKDKVGTLIIDEAHCFCSKSRIKPLLAFSPRYVIAETATPKKDNEMHKIIQSICGTHYIEKISDKPYNCYIIQTNLDIKTEENSFTELVSNQCNSQERNKIIIDLITHNKHKKIIIISPRVNHCDIIHKQLQENGIEAGKLYGKAKKYKTSSVLIGTTSKMGVGFDEENFCDNYDGKASDLLIVTQTFKSWPSFEQVRGRGMRAINPNVIYLNDKHIITRRHMSIMRKYMKETNGNIHEIKIKEPNNQIYIS